MKQCNKKSKFTDIPNKFDALGLVLGYDYILHKWVYDVKYYLNGNNWCLDPEGENILREINDQETKIIARHQHTIIERERENAAWSNHKRCRKRSCICKKCDKYCHCYECTNKIDICNQVKE